MIFPEYKIIFVHIPKTGGTSLTHNLFNCLNYDDKTLFSIYQDRNISHRSTGKAHIRASEYKKYLGDEYKEYYSFSIIRNPFEQIRSLFAQLKNMNLSINARFKYYKKMSFEEFVMNSSRHSLKGNRYLVDQVRSISYRGKVIVDDVFLYEDYDKVVNEISRRTGCKIDKTIKLRKSNWSFEYTPEMVERVLNLYGHVYEYYKSKKK